MVKTKHTPRKVSSKKQSGESSPANTEARKTRPMTNLEDLRFVPASYIRTSMRKIEVLIAALRKEDGIIGTAVADILEDGIFDDLDEAAEILEIGVSHA